MAIKEFEFEFVHFDAEQAIRDARRGIPPFQHSGNIQLVKYFTDIEMHKVEGKFENRMELGYYIRLNRLRELELNKGEVIKLAKNGKVVIEPIITPFDGVVSIQPSDFKLLSGESALIDDRGYVVSSGDFGTLKRLALKYVLDGKFEFNYYIVNKKTGRSYVITGKYEKVDSRVNLMSTTKRLVLPLYRYILYGYLSNHSVS